jgi:hypothetical protein
MPYKIVLTENWIEYIILINNNTIMTIGELEHNSLFYVINQYGQIDEYAVKDGNNEYSYIVGDNAVYQSKKDEPILQEGDMSILFKHYREFYVQMGLTKETIFQLIREWRNNKTSNNTL